MKAQGRRDAGSSRPALQMPPIPCAPCAVTDTRGRTLEFTGTGMDKNQGRGRVDAARAKTRHRAVGRRQRGLVRETDSGTRQTAQKYSADEPQSCSGRASGRGRPATTRPGKGSGRPPHRLTALHVKHRTRGSQEVLTSKRG